MTDRLLENGTTRLQENNIVRILEETDAADFDGIIHGVFKQVVKDIVNVDKIVERKVDKTKGKTDDNLHSSTHVRKVRKKSPSSKNLPGNERRKPNNRSRKG